MERRSAREAHGRRGQARSISRCDEEEYVGAVKTSQQSNRRSKYAIDCRRLLHHHDCPDRSSARRLEHKIIRAACKPLGIVEELISSLRYIGVNKGDDLSRKRIS